MCKRILSLILILILLSIVPLCASAHEIPNSDRLGSISITMTYQKKPVFGGTLTLYRVADVVSDNGDYLFAYTDDFSGCSIPVTKLNDADLPTELADIAKTKKLQGTTLTVGKSGKVTFSNLTIGLYLIVQEESASGYKKINPFLVSLPRNDNGHYIYDVDTAPKNLPGLETEPTEPSKPTEPTQPSESKLPQTGQTNWPIPVMAVLGILMLCAGLYLSASGKKKNNEA